MPGSEETPDSPSGSPPSPPSYKNSTVNADGNKNKASSPPANLEQSDNDDTTSSNESPPPPTPDNDEGGDNSSNETSPPPKSSPEKSPPPSSPSPPPPSPEKKTGEDSPESSNAPPAPSKQQSPPPSSPPPSKQQSPPPSTNSPPDSSKSTPEKSSPSPPPPSPPPPSDSSGKTPPSQQSPPSPSSDSTPPPSQNTTPTPSGSFSPPPSNFSNNSVPKPALMPPPSPISPKNHTSPSTENNDKKDNNGKNIYQAAAGAAVAGLFIIALVSLFFCLRRRNKKKRRQRPPYGMPPPPNFQVTTDAYIAMGNSGRNDSNFYYNSQGGQQPHSNMVSSFGGSQRGESIRGPDSGLIATSKTFFGYEELMEITNGFSRQNIIGEGGFGCVYKGWLRDGKIVAVKQLKAGSGQGEREFRAEVEIISRVHHRHLVSLVGYCIAENQRLLIYEFVPNNTLEHHLYGKNLPVLEWSRRVKIAAGAAKGLAYLHEDCHPRIIHRDIKSANILLQEDFEAQVADFGLARLNDTTQTHVSTRVMGTFGYLAPEYASSGKLTDRSDVFSFGVVLLELITGRKPVDPTQPLGDESLVEWARPLLIEALETGNLGILVDQRLEKRYVESEMFRMIEAAAACVRHSATKRPRMVAVARALDFEGDSSDLSNGVKFGQSTVYDSGQYSQEIMNFRRLALASDNSSEFDYSGEYNSREVAQQRGGQQNNTWNSRYSSGEFTSGELEKQAFKPNTNSDDYSTGASGNYGGGRFRYS